MGFRTKSYAKVKKVASHDNGALEAQITICKKNKNGEYELCFSNWCRLIGKAAEKKPKEGDSIQILDCDVTNAYVKEGSVCFTKSPKFIIYDLAFPNQTISRVEEEAISTLGTPLVDFESIEFDDITF